MESRDTNPSEPPGAGVMARRIHCLHEILAALSSATAIFFMLLTFAKIEPYNRLQGISNLSYYFPRNAIRLADLLHITVARTVTIRYARNFEISRVTLAGLELLFLGSIVCAVLLFLSGLRLASSARSKHTDISFISGGLALFALPLICMVNLKRQWTSRTHDPFWSDPGIQILLAEIAVTALLAILAKRRPFSLRISSALLLLHSALWIPFAWIMIPALPDAIQPLHTPNLLLFLFPVTGIVWLLDRGAQYPVATTAQPRPRMVAWSAWALLAVAALAFLWRPVASQPLDRAGVPDSAIITMSRGSCFGNCPVYQLTIHGSGEVEYEGHRRFPPKPVQYSSKLSREQIREILQILDRADFMALEDRAFGWSFDTPTVGITVSVNGKTKEVVSDASVDFTPMSPIQTRFVEAAKKIDAIVGVERWIER